MLLLMYLHYFGVWTTKKMTLQFQIKDCMTRYNGDTDQQRRKKFSFPARLICADCYEVKQKLNAATHLICYNQM
jgi:hypothetical protein